MKTICITCDPNGKRFKETERHLSQGGISVVPFLGFNNRLAGLTTSNTYEIDHPGTGYRISGATIGIALSHWMVWRAMQVWDDERVVVFEDDARFASNGKERYEKAMAEVPADCDILYLGSCCAAGKPTKNIVGEINAVQWPLCTHAYMISKSAAMVMFDRHDSMWAPVDLSMVFDVYSKSNLKVLTVIPRIFDQHETVLGY